VEDGRSRDRAGRAANARCSPPIVVTLMLLRMRWIRHELNVWVPSAAIGGSYTTTLRWRFTIAAEAAAASMLVRAAAC
jgi:hypothetical protein